MSAVAGFVALLVLSMRVYPGGTAWDHAAPGNDFWLNYLCDLERTVALNGVPNPAGSALTRAAMLVLGLGFLPLYGLLPRLFDASPRLGRAVRWLGAASVAGIVALVLMPADRFGDAHGVVVVVAGVPGLLAVLLAIIGLARGEPAPRVGAVTGGVMLLVSTVDFGLYIRQLFGEGPGPMAVAVLERLATLLVLLWMAVIAWRARVMSRKDRDRAVILPSPDRAA